MPHSLQKWRHALYLRHLGHQVGTGHRTALGNSELVPSALLCKKSISGPPCSNSFLGVVLVLWGFSCHSQQCEDGQVSDTGFID